MLQFSYEHVSRLTMEQSNLIEQRVFLENYQVTWHTFFASVSSSHSLARVPSKNIGTRALPLTIQDRKIGQENIGSMCCE